MAKGYVTIPVGYKRMDAEPLLDDEVFESIGEAETFASGTTAYGGKIISVLVDGLYRPYLCQPDGTLTPVAAEGGQAGGCWDTWED